MAITPRKYLAPNVPTQPTPTGGGGGMVFPNDLITQGRNFSTRISLQQYTNGFGINIGRIMNQFVGGGITLPIPRKINDVQTVIWEEASIVSAGVEAAKMSNKGLGGVVGGLQNLGGIAAVGGAFVGGGIRLNPALMMLFKQPQFKEWNLQWTLAPNSKDESDTLSNIIKQLKRASSPGTDGPVYTYPNLAHISFSPSEYLPNLKPCAIMAVQVDFTASGMPSFFESGAPTVINLTLSLRETELWTNSGNF